MPLFKPDTMSDILATTESARSMSLIGEAKVQISLASSHTSIENVRQLSSSLSVAKKSLPERIPAFGLLMAILSVICFSIASVIVRIEVTLPAIEILVVRSFYQFIVYFIATLICRFEFFGQTRHRWDLFLRALAGTISLSFIYVAYRLIPLSDASTIHFASPVFVTIFAYFLLKEPLTKLQIFTGITTLTGVVIIAKPEFLFGSESNEIHEMRFEGTVLAVVASMTGGFAMITLRKLKTTPVAVVVMWYSFTLVLAGSIYLTIMQKWVMPQTWSTLALLNIIGITGVFDQYLITLAFQYEKAGPISVVRTINIVLSFLWEVLLLNEEIQVTSVLGACLICSCVILLALIKWYRESPESFEVIRRKICCFCPAPGPKSKSMKRSIRKSSKKISSLANSVKQDPNNSTRAISIDINDEPLMIVKSKKLSGSNESLDSIAVQNTVNSNAILLMKSSDDDEDDVVSDSAAKIKPISNLAKKKDRRLFLKK